MVVRRLASSVGSGGVAVAPPVPLRDRASGHLVRGGQNRTASCRAVPTAISENPTAANSAWSIRFFTAGRVRFSSSVSPGMRMMPISTVRTRVSPALPDVHGPPSPVGFGISGVWAQRLLRESPQATRRRQPVTRHRVAGSRELTGWPWLIRHSAVTDLGRYAWRSAQPEGSGSSRLPPRH